MESATRFTPDFGSTRSLPSNAQKVTFSNARDPGPAHRHQSPLSEYSRQLSPRQESNRYSPGRQESDRMSPQFWSSRISSRGSSPQRAGSASPSYARVSYQDRRADGSLQNGSVPASPVIENLIGGFLYSSPSTQKIPTMAPHTSTGKYDPEKCREDEMQPSATMTSMYNPSMRALDNPLTTGALRRQFGDDTGAKDGQREEYIAALTGSARRIASSKNFPKQNTEFSMVDAAIGHSNALQLREELRIDLQQLDLLVSDISHFRSKHAGAEIQRMKQRGSTIQQWCQAFQHWFTDRATSIMKNAEVIRRDQESLNKDVREQFLSAQENVEGLEKQVANMSKKLQEESARYSVKLASTNQRKERLERQLRSLEAKRDTETALFHRNTASGESDIEEMEIAVAKLEREVMEKEAESRAQEQMFRERYKMLAADREKHRQQLSEAITRGTWEARFVDLVESSRNKAENITNPVRTMRREQAWDEIENLEHELRSLDKSDDPLRTALVKIADAEVGASKASMTQLRKLYDQMMVVRNLSHGVNATLTSLSLRHPIFFQKTPHELQDHFEALAATNTIQQIPINRTLNLNDPSICAISAKNTQEKSRFRQKLDTKNLTDRKRFEEGDISFLSNSKKRFDKEPFFDVMDVDTIIADVHPIGGFNQRGSSKVSGQPVDPWADFKEVPKNGSDGDITGEINWATFGDAFE